MKFYLVFEQSGDNIPFVSENSDLLEYYINFINHEKINKFSPIHNLAEDFITELQNIQDVLLQYNKTESSEFTGKFSVVNNLEDFLNQEYLNAIHYQWVHSNHREYTFSTIKELNVNNKYQLLVDQLPDNDDNIPASEIVYKYNTQELYFDINQAIHSVESLFKNIQYQGDYNADWNWKEIKNIFPKKYTSNCTSNLKISFNHCGRTLYDKFLNQSGTVFYDDENTYNQLLGFLSLSLHPVETIHYSQEYLDWCSNIKREPGGDNLNIGYIPNLPDHLTEYRKIIYRNTLSQNKFQLVI